MRSKVARKEPGAGSFLEFLITPGRVRAEIGHSATLLVHDQSLPCLCDLHSLQNLLLGFCQVAWCPTEHMAARPTWLMTRGCK